jgi:hypothetical protein
MAKKEVTRTVEVCDVCKREKDTYEACQVCNREMCLTCRIPAMTGSYYRPYICKECGEREDVQVIVKEKYGPKIGKLVEQRRRELREIDPDYSIEED